MIEMTIFRGSDGFTNEIIANIGLDKEVAVWKRDSGICFKPMCDNAQKVSCKEHKLLVDSINEHLVEELRKHNK